MTNPLGYASRGTVVVELAPNPATAPGDATPRIEELSLFSRLIDAERFGWVVTVETAGVAPALRGPCAVWMARCGVKDSSTCTAQMRRVSAYSRTRSAIWARQRRPSSSLSRSARRPDSCNSARRCGPTTRAPCCGHWRRSPPTSIHLGVSSN